MEIGIDSFAAFVTDAQGNPVGTAQDALRELLDRIQLADEKGLDVFAIGEHHRKEFLDSATSVILAAAAARTSRIRLSSAVTVLSAADPVRVFQQFATLDLLSQGRAELVVGRGSFTEAFPLFGLNIQDYDTLFAEKLDLLLQLNEQEVITWKGAISTFLAISSDLSKAYASQTPHLVGRRWYTRFLCAGRFSWTSLNGSCNWWGDAPFPSLD